jgi:hypothetical protein
MMRARQHPCNRYGWLYCHPEHYQSAFDQQVRLVNEASKADPSFSGEPAEMQPWSEQQLRGLASDPFYAKQFQQHTEKLQVEADAVVQQLERTLHELAAKVDALQAERHHLLTFLEGDD